MVIGGSEIAERGPRALNCVGAEMLTGKRDYVLRRPHWGLKVRNPNCSLPYFSQQLASVVGDRPGKPLFLIYDFREIKSDANCCTALHVKFPGGITVSLVNTYCKLLHP